MKVKVSYTVDVDEVPDLINRMMSECKEKLSGASDNLKPFAYNLDKMAAQLEEVRTALSVVDSQLEDVLNLAAGWLEVKRAPELEHSSAATAEDPGVESGQES